MVRMSRLPGRSVKGFGCSFQRHQLWLSHEFLLYREINGYREEVKRYYFGDIQAIVCGPTRAWMVFNWINGVLLALSIALITYIVMSGAEQAFLVFPGLAVSFAAPLLLGNLILGPSCKTTLYTATSEARLYSLGRRRSALKAVNAILPFIEAAQAVKAAAGPSQAYSPPEFEHVEDSETTGMSGESASPSGA